MDGVRKHHRDFVGINVQFYCNEKQSSVVKTLACVESKERKTGNFFAQVYAL